MTKFKSKKITKSTIAVIIMAIAMVAMLAFGGTYALFTATSNTKTAEFTTGTVKLKSGAITTTSLTRVLPGDQVMSAVTYSAADSTVQTFVAVKIAFEKFVAGQNEQPGHWVDMEAGEVDLLSFALSKESNEDVWIKVTTENVGNVYVYKNVVEPNRASIPFCGAINFNAHARYIEKADGSDYDYVIGDEGAQPNAATSPLVEGVQLRITVTGYAVQARGLGIDAVQAGENGNVTLKNTMDDTLANALYGKMLETTIA